MENNSDLDRVRAAQQMIDKETLSSNVCWFCDQPTAEEKWAQEIYLYRNFTTELGLTGQRHKWEALSRKLPCCRKCFRTHKRVARLSRFGTWLGGISGFILFVGTSLVISIRLKAQSVQSFGFILFILIFAGVIASAFSGYWLGKKSAYYFSPKTKPVKFALQHPIIASFAEQGWNLGNPANN